MAQGLTGAYYCIAREQNAGDGDHSRVKQRFQDRGVEFIMTQTALASAAPGDLRK